MPSPTLSDKAELRRTALARRDAIPQEMREAAAQAIASRPFPVEMPRGSIVSGFMPIGSEIDPLPLMSRLATAGVALALPVVAGPGRPLIMRSWTFEEPVLTGTWGIRVPLPEAPAVEPDILIVPLAAFDRKGHRIGYGAGYYDRTLSALRDKKRIVAIGMAFAIQEISRVPASPLDQRLDFLMTEKETIAFST